MVCKHLVSCEFLGQELMHFQLLNRLAFHIFNVVHCSAYKNPIFLAPCLPLITCPLVYFYSIHDLRNISPQHHFLSREFCQVTWESHLFHKSN